jgi:hypothetical protein
LRTICASAGSACLRLHPVGSVPAIFYALYPVLSDNTHIDTGVNMRINGAYQGKHLQSVTACAVPDTFDIRPVTAKSILLYFIYKIMIA